MGEIKKGTRLKNKTSEDYATVLHVDGTEVTIIVEGYAASNIYSLSELEEGWEVTNG